MILLSLELANRVGLKFNFETYWWYQKILYLSKSMIIWSFLFQIVIDLQILCAYGPNFLDGFLKHLTRALSIWLVFLRWLGFVVFRQTILSSPSRILLQKIPLQWITFHLIQNKQKPNIYFWMALFCMLIELPQGHSNSQDWSLWLLQSFLSFCQ